jgi:hypothetical protein
VEDPEETILLTRKEAVIKTEQMKVFKECKDSLKQFLAYCHPSRPYDRMTLGLVEVMLVCIALSVLDFTVLTTTQAKARITIEYPWGHTITKTMTPEQRMDMLRSSVIIIQTTHTMHTDEQMADYFWFFRGFVQVS